MSTGPRTLPHFAVVLNPNAGAGLALREWPKLEAELKSRGLTYELIREHSGQQALRKLQRLRKDIAVMALGGDGTIGALLPALVGTGRPLAVIPLGTGNDFAGMLKLRPGRFDEALARLEHQPRQVDALEVHIEAGEKAGQRFVLLNGLGMGFDSQVTHNMRRAPERFQGFSRYAWSAIATIRELVLTGVEVQVDGKSLYAGPSALVAVMNGTRYGGGFRISPKSDARDGLLNVLASGPVTRMQLTTLMLRVLQGKHLGSPNVHHTSGHTAHIKWSAPVQLHLDGDLHGEVTQLSVKVLPGAVALLNG